MIFCDADLKRDEKIDPEDVRRDGGVKKRKGKRQCFFLFLKKKPGLCCLEYFWNIVFNINFKENYYRKLYFFAFKLISLNIYIYIYIYIKLNFRIELNFKNSK